MGEQLEHVVPRDGWPAGPWDGEPDRWEGRHAGFPILVVRAHLGALCGYVGVPPGHPWHGVDYNGVEALSSPDVHGGLTYSNSCQLEGPICHVAKPGEPDAVWWLGFDCNHSGDLAPGMRAGEAGRIHRKVNAEYGLVDRDVYRPLAYVQEQTRQLADQAAAAAAR